MENQNPIQPNQEVPQPQTPPVEEKPKLKFSHIKLIVFGIIAAVIIAGLGGTLVLNKSTVGKITPTPTISPTPTPDPTADWQTYEGNGFSFRYPPQYLIQDPIFSVTLWSLDINNEVVPGQMQLFQDSGNFNVPKSGTFSNPAFFPALEKNKVIESYEETQINSKKIIKIIYNCGVDCQFHAMTFSNGSTNVLFEMNTAGGGLSNTFNQILSTFKFTEPKISCTPRPACFDATPRCLMPETSDMCPPSITPTKSNSSANGTVCAQDAKQCPDGSWVGRSGPKCEFKCP